MAETFIHDDIKLYITADRFYLEPNINPTEVLVIERLTAEASVKANVEIPIPSSAYRPVCGFLGSIKLISGYYLIVANYRIFVGKINGHEIYKLAGADIIPYARTQTHLSQDQIRDNATYESMLRAALEAPGIYFSYTLDLTQSMQRLYTSSADKQSLLGRAEKRFLWNGHALSPFKDQQFCRFTLPIIQGFVSINEVKLNEYNVTWSLVSRRSVERAGTRLFMRGADSQGNVANFVETEQIVEHADKKASFVQTRGSIPLHWQQLPDLRYKPPMRLTDGEHVAACSKHLTAQVEAYGAQVLVNLIDQRGKEKCLADGFRAAVATAAVPSVRYEAFDFHAECKGMRYDRLNILIDRVAHELDEFGLFLWRAGIVVTRQSGVFRTNCIDCLDRTNVVQSLLASRQLTVALRSIGVLSQGQNVQQFDAFTYLFNNVWADHADMISTQYSGTGALKTDFTRTGKRTQLGLLRDGINSMTRYYKNNFCDGFRQDATDLFLGHYVVTDGEGVSLPCPLKRDRDWKYVTFPSVLLVAMSMFCASAVLPSEYTGVNLLYIVFWGAMFGTTLTFIFKHGREFVDWPRLAGGGPAPRSHPGL